MYLLLTMYEVHTVSYELGILPFDLWLKHKFNYTLAISWEGKKRILSLIHSKDWEDKGGKKILGKQYYSHTEFTISNDWWLHVEGITPVKSVINYSNFLISGVHVSYIWDSWLFIHCILLNNTIAKFMFWTFWENYRLQCQHIICRISFLNHSIIIHPALLKWG